jgi:hypothetical protein
MYLKAALRAALLFLSSLALDSRYIGYQSIGLRPLIEHPRSYIARAATLSKAHPNSSSCEGIQIYRPETEPRTQNIDQNPEPTFHPAAPQTGPKNQTTGTELEPRTEPEPTRNPNHQNHGTTKRNNPQYRR